MKEIFCQNTKNVHFSYTHGERWFCYGFLFVPVLPGVFVVSLGKSLASKLNIYRNF